MPRKKTPKELPENAKGEVGLEPGEQSPVEAAVAQGWGTKKQGLNYSDVNAMVRALRAGASWEEAKATAGHLIEDRALELHKPDILERVAKLERELGAGVNGNAAPTADHVEQLNGKEALRLQNVARAQQPSGRRRHGMRDDEAKLAVRMLQRGDLWREVVRRFEAEVTLEALELRKQEFHQAAGIPLED